MPQLNVRLNVHRNASKRKFNTLIDASLKARAKARKISLERYDEFDYQDRLEAHMEE